MGAVFGAWAVSAVLLVLLAVLLSAWMKPPRVPLGILIDSRGRYSLTHFQLVVWSIVILSLISGVFWGRLIHGVDDPLGFTIPGPVLGLLGISVGSAVSATVVKASKDAMAPERIAASGELDPPRFRQIFMLEEGAYADQVVDITKFQNFVFTVILVVAYIALSIHAIEHAKVASAVTTLPTFSGTFLILVGISQGGYVAGKIPSQAGIPAGLTVESRGVVSATFAPRNSKKSVASLPLAAQREALVARRAYAIAHSPENQNDRSNWLRAANEVDSELNMIDARAKEIGAQEGAGSPLAAGCKPTLSCEPRSN